MAPLHVAQVRNKCLIVFEKLEVGGEGHSAKFDCVCLEPLFLSDGSRCRFLGPRLLVFLSKVISTVKVLPGSYYYSNMSLL